MKIVTINIPDVYLDCLEIMINFGYFPSRSEAVREALKQFLTKEDEINRDLAKERFASLKKAEMKSMLR